MPKLSTEEIRSLIASRKFWYHQIQVAPGIVTPGINNCASTLNLLGLPKDMTGLRVLDIGPAEGFQTHDAELSCV